jgi:hypothetical protein
MRICAPFGLDDLFAMVVRPNKTLVTREVYDEKVRRWRTAWPRLTGAPPRPAWSLRTRRFATAPPAGL